jgi:hypothetical protein
MTIQNFILTRDINGYNGFGVPFSNSEFQFILTPNVVSSLTVPFTQNAVYQNLLAIFSPTEGNDVWVAVNNTPIIPASNTPTACNCERNPGGRWVKAGDIINFITADSNVQVGVIFYASY